MVRVEIVFRVAADRRYGTGDAEVSPSVSEGRVSVVVNGRLRTYDLATVLPIHEDRILFADNPPLNACGVMQTIARRGQYLAIEAIVAQKGCSPIASFIDLASGRVAKKLSR